MEFELLAFQRGDERLDQQHTLRGFSRSGDLELVRSMRLKFRGPFSKQTANGFTDLQFGFGPRAVAVGKTFPAEVFDRGENAVKGLDAVSDLFDHRGLRARTWRLCGACACHEIEKSLAQGESPGKETRESHRDVRARTGA